MKQHAKQDLIYGKRPILEALTSGMKLSSIKVSETAGKDSLLDRIIEIAKNNSVKFERVPNKELKRFVDDRNFQGIVAVVAPFEYAPLSRCIENANSSFEQCGAALIVVCDHITDVGNLGAIIRSAESVGAECVVLPNARSASVNSVVYKTSAGAVAHLPIVQVSNIARTLDDLKNNGFWVVGASEHADDEIWDSNLEGKIAIVLGNEEKGISSLSLKNCDDTFKLPQRGNVSSLNVAQASTVFMYEWVRQNGLH